MTKSVELVRKNASKILKQEVEVRSDGVLECQLEARNLLERLTALRDNEKSKFKILTDIFAVDYQAREARFDVVYMLLSVVFNARMCCKVPLVEGRDIPSVTSVFGAAGWFEREVFDMYGIKFDKHPDLRRILTDYGFSGHPMLKDFPLTGYDEVRYDIQKKQVVYQPVNLQQDFRNFDATSPWKGDK
ncbi:MAG: NADH-quinone oxidoreductase subunit C [Anaplasma ovis]|uniref:NADH-quinone oxidoreductase subunit C n=1 Tax=Anaplasma ovis str. Haibei TaxID=1248439 RepID=A0A2Z2LER9_9RICK|nr:NADH-quinone oxidoreductase subunit C [Anaplasma ovis]ASI47580.1 NADH-quinone oxidoreductase subunit C [Anaplasma ovis str. Haibei]